MNVISDHIKQDVIPKKWETRKVHSKIALNTVLRELVVHGVRRRNPKRLSELS